MIDVRRDITDQPSESETSEIAQLLMAGGVRLLAGIAAPVKKAVQNLKQGTRGERAGRN
jgi:Tfp pilus assembly PilM family ATPase